MSNLTNIPTSPIEGDELLTKSPDFDPDKFDPIKLAHSIATAGYAWAESDGTAKVKDSTENRLKAKIILEYIAGQRNDPYADKTKDKPKAPSVERAKLLAENDEEYVTAVDDGISARTQANKLRVRYDVARAMYEGLRSKEATYRATTTLR